MSQYKTYEPMTLRADSDCRVAGQYRIVAVGDANGDFSICGAGGTASAVRPIGVLQNKPNTNEFGAIAYYGTSKVIMKENCSRGDIIVGDDAGGGKGEVADADKEKGVGIALEANAAGDGAVIEVLLNPGITHSQ